LFPARDDEIRADRVFRRAGDVDVIEACADQSEVVAAYAQDRFGPKSRGADARVSNVQAVAFGRQVDVILDRLLNDLTDGHSFWLLRLRGDRTRNVRKKKNENKAGKPEAQDQFNNFFCASVRLSISPAKPPRRE
jgi:hypothetical protein